MSSSHRPHSAHLLRFGSVVRSVVGATFLAVAGLSYLYLKHQLYEAGARKKSLETELRDLGQQGRVLDAQIAALTSRTALQQRLDDGFIHMVKIPSADVVHIRLLPEGSNGGGASSSGLASVNNPEETATPAVAGGGLRPASRAQRTVRQ